MVCSTFLTSVIRRRNGSKRKALEIKENVDCQDTGGGERRKKAMMTTMTTGMMRLRKSGMKIMKITKKWKIKELAFVVRTGHLLSLSF